MIPSTTTLLWVSPSLFGDLLIANVVCTLPVLDPRYKDTLFTVNSSIIEELFSEDWTSDCANALIESYEEFYDTPAQPSSFKAQPLRIEKPNVSAFDHAFKASVPRRPGTTLGSSRSLHREVSEYLMEDTIEDSESPLTWWRNNASRFPRLATMARDFLCIPGTMQFSRCMCMFVITNTLA